MHENAIMMYISLDINWFAKKKRKRERRKEGNQGKEKNRKEINLLTPWWRDGRRRET